MYKTTEPEICYIRFESFFKKLRKRNILFGTGFRNAYQFNSLRSELTIHIIDYSLSKRANFLSTQIVAKGKKAEISANTKSSSSQS